MPDTFRTSLSSSTTIIVTLTSGLNDAGALQLVDANGTLIGAGIDIGLPDGVDAAQIVILDFSNWTITAQHGTSPVITWGVYGSNQGAEYTFGANTDVDAIVTATPQAGAVKTKTIRIKVTPKGSSVTGSKTPHGKPNPETR